MDRYHLTPDGGEWLLTAEGADKPAKTFRSKEEGISGSADYLKDREASLKIHGEDGEIEEERTYPRSADPQRSPG